VQAFTLNSGAKLATANVKGIASNGSIQITGTQTYSTSANYVYNGSVAQVTGALMPATVNNLTVNNASGVTLSQPLTITDTLFLLAGTLSGTYTAGTTITGVTDVQENSAGMTRKFFVNQNYPNPFNPSTTIQFGLPKTTFVTIKVYNIMGQEVETLFTGNKSAGVHTLHFDASSFSSGVYLYRIQAGSSVEVKRMLFVK
jgi:hypothetical protein